MLDIKWESISDEELIKLAKESSENIKKRIENKKNEITKWVSQFGSDEDMVVAYMGDNSFSSYQITKELIYFFKGTNKEKLEQIKTTINNLLKENRVIKNGDNYSRKQ